MPGTFLFALHHIFEFSELPADKEEAAVGVEEPGSYAVSSSVGEEGGPRSRVSTRRIELNFVKRLRRMIELNAIKREGMIVEGKVNRSTHTL